VFLCFCFWFKMVKKVKGFEQSYEEVHPEEGRMTYFKNGEKPRLGDNNKPARTKPMRYYVPKHKFYYTQKEFFEELYEKMEDRGVKKSDLDKLKRRKKIKDLTKDGKIEEIPYERVSKSKERVYERTNVDGKKLLDSLKRPKYKTLGMGIRGDHIYDPSYIAYYTPSPARDAHQIADLHRRRAMVAKSDVCYPIKSGIIPRYYGYVPGQKFRFGGTFGYLTRNAKEIGYDISRAWGGLTSLPDCPNWKIDNDFQSVRKCDLRI